MIQCVDIEFAQPQDCPQVTPDNCFNSSDISFAGIYTTALTATSGADGGRLSTTFLAALAPLFVVALCSLVI
jgi:hypothetical protein